MDTHLPEYELYAIRYAERDARRSDILSAATRMTARCRCIPSCELRSGAWRARRLQFLAWRSRSLAERPPRPHRLEA